MGEDQRLEEERLHECELGQMQGKLGAVGPWNAEGGEMDGSKSI